ncbi:MAG TPA: nitronate monooxygenase [Gemmatimonadaceae bacterium]|jgi:nitronate monooxygenase|nr:nitronate monooxygenase [Gemmatimonadaceae bacterium]
MSFTSSLNVTHPIIQAPMAGANATPPALVAAVGNAGGLGFIGAAYMSPEQIVRESAAIRALTVHPFGINLFAPVESPPPPTAAQVQSAIGAIATYHDELGLSAPAAPPAPAFRFEDQLSVALECGARVFSFTFGQVPPSAMRALKARHIYVIGTATTVDEAMLLERSGVDAIAAQGSEAGAHRGTFAAPFESAMIGTMALVPQIVRAVRVPVLASGGIMTGRGIAAATALGAAAVQMGTAFLTTHECGVAETHKRAILDATEDATRVTRAFSGRPARGIVNRAMTEIETAPAAILPYPYQNSLTRVMRNAASDQDRAEFLSLWAGQGVRLARRMGAAELVRTLVAES